MAIQTLNTIKKWFKTGLKPSQDQFWDTWDSYRHKYEKVPIKDIEDLENTLDTKAEKSQLDDHKNNHGAHAELFLAKEDKSQKGLAGGYAPLDEFSKITQQYLNVINNLTAGGETSLLSAEQGVVLQNQIDTIYTLLKSDNVDLDTIQKIVDAVEQIQISLNSILVNDLTTGGIAKALTAEMGKLLQTSKEDKSQKGIAGGYVPLNDLATISSQYLTIINDLTTGGAASILSAEQGVVLQNQIDSINTLLSSDNLDLDTIQEIVDAIEEVQMSLDTILVNDLTTGGVTKALTAEMGKQLNEIKLTGTIATDEETQIETEVPEDNKVISRSKLFNWWEKRKTLPEVIGSTWNFEKGLEVKRKIGNYNFITEMTETGFNAKYMGPTLYYNARYSDRLISWYINRYSTTLYPVNPTQDNFLYLPNESGTLAIKEDYLSTPAGTTTTPSLIIPNGELTTVPQNGAIERDSTGQLWETHNGARTRIVTTDYINSIYDSGTYTPSLENILNVTGATLLWATYTKIDNIITVMIALTATPVSFSDVQIDISLPFNRNVSTSLLSGIATGATANANFSAQVSVLNKSKAAITYKSSTSGLSNITANFSYSIN